MSLTYGGDPARPRKARKKKPNCDRCKDEGTRFILRRGNPFAMSIFVLANNVEKIICDCDVGRAYRDALPVREAI